MLRLWPERLTAAVFPEACRLYCADGRETAKYVPADVADFDVIDWLNVTLDNTPRRVRTQIDLVVSDSLARSIPLPWHDGLTNDEQCDAYARACFDQAGLELEGEWVVQAAYRHFRAVGLGYALPRSLVVEIQSRLSDREIQLRSVMPMSAYAYWRNTVGARGKWSVLLLREFGRLTALSFEGKKCAGIHVQPMGIGFSDAARRLLSMLDAICPPLSNVRFWSCAEDESEIESIRSRFGSASFEVLSGLRWD